jgi:SAM-dependent methyltransferase
MQGVIATAKAGEPIVQTARKRFTFRGNLDGTRHGWLRLTPAYSVHFVREVLETAARTRGPVLDPFCGTGTTLLCAAELGLDVTTIDLNPFLVWLARAKTADYGEDTLRAATELIGEMASAARARSGPTFVPRIHRIDRWWGSAASAALGRAAHLLRERDDVSEGARDLASLALCRALIACASVSFGHQSMSFRRGDGERRKGAASVASALGEALVAVSASAARGLGPGTRRVVRGDSRDVAKCLRGKNTRFGTVVTSPPYSNRMSYIRELRPYMYWLGHLTERKDAGELDWQAIGGTWGAATSRLGTWKPSAHRIPFDGFDDIVRKISDTEPILGSYVHRYFEDMRAHVRSLRSVLARGADLHYVVGNSKFYDVMLPAERIFAALFAEAGFTGARVTELRKRTSKKELFEYLVSATWPGEGTLKLPAPRPPGTRAG